MKTLLIGKKDSKDYAGSKTLYAFNALTEAGVKAEIYDINSSVDIPLGVTTSIYLPWVESIDSTWAKFLKMIPGRRVLYTDNWYWYDQTCGKMSSEKNIDLESIFHLVAFATTENARWWPKSKFEWWGALVDEDLAVPRKPQGYIWVDELWPKKWCDGIFSAVDALNIAIPQIKKQYGLSVLSQVCNDPDAPRPTWVDQYVPAGQDIEQMLSHLAGATAYFTSHHECLGLMQFESMVTGVPVVTNSTLSKNETFMASGGAYNWSPIASDPPSEILSEDPEVVAKNICAAFDLAIAADRNQIRQSAVERYGKKAFVERISITEK